MNKTREFLIRMENTLSQELITLRTQTGNLVRYHPFLVNYTMHVVIEVDDYSRRLIASVDQLKSALQKLSTGVLPQELISHFQLALALEHAQDVMMREQPDYELVETEVAHYFKTSNIGYAVEGFDLVVQVPAYIKLKNHPLFDLYRIETIHVPYDVSHGNSHEDGDNSDCAFTKIKLDTHYVASFEDNYILIENTRINECDRLGSVVVCADKFLHANKGSHRCQSALFWEQPMDIALQKCKFEYCHELQPPSTFVSNQTHILLVNVAVPWHIYCNSKSLPHRNRGERYAMVAKASLCDCSIVTSRHVVPPQITESSEEKFILNMSYPLNAAVMYNFKHELGNLSAEFDYYKSKTKK